MISLVRPSRARAGALGLLTVAFLVVATRPPVGAGEPSDPGSELLAAARARVDAADFAGTVVVEWRAGTTTRREVVEVRGSDGTIEVFADRSFAMTADGVLRHDDEGWVTVGAADALDVVPTPGDKYRLDVSDGPIVAGRTTTVVDAVLPEAAVLVERIFLDRETGIMLRRERYDASGTEVLRSVSFTEFRAGPTDVAAVTASVDDIDAPGRLDGSYRDPEHAGDGFALLARTVDESGTAQLLYGDGLLTVSVFEEPGQLDWAALPSGGEPAEVDGVDAARYVLPVGVAYVWERGGVVYTAVSDAPEEQILAVAASVSGDRVEGRIADLARTMLASFEL